MRNAVFAWVSCGSLLVLGCGSPSAGETAAPATEVAAPVKVAPPAPEPAKPAEPAGPAPSVVEDPTFKLHLVEAGPYKSGELGHFSVQLEARGIYHINQEFPIEMAFTAGADTALTKAKLERADAAEFGEKTARFDVPFTAKTAGEHRVAANVKFAVCTPETCVPDERNLSLALAVQ